MLCLSALKKGCYGRVDHLTAEGGMRRRLLDLGLTSGAKVTCLFSAPGGGMRAYRVRGAVVALRQRDAAGVCLWEERHG